MRRKHIIAVRFSNARDHELVTAHLALLGYEAVHLPDDGAAADADLYLLDSRAARRLGERILALKKASDVFLPTMVALKARDAAARWLSIGFDECIWLPVSKAELANRVEILLRLRRQSELLAERSEIRYRAIFEATGTATLLVEDDGTILMANRECLPVTGYAPSELIGSKWTHYIAPESLDVIFSRRRAQRRDPELAATKYEVKLVGKNGEIRDVILDLAVVPGTRQSVVSMLDITEFLQLAEERDRLQEQLIQTQKMEAIGRLAGGVAHDFNNMLSVILGYGEYLLENLRAEDPLREPAQQIVEAGRRSSALTRQLLAFSRKQALQPEVLDLNELVENLHTLLERLIGEDINLVLVLTDRPWPVKVDAGQIEQVIMNLAVNARDAMPNGGRLLIETANVELDDQYAHDHVDVAAGPHVMLAVTDNGCGMDKETVSKIFDPFFTTKEKGKGTGLGLATVYGIVKQSGGTIWAYSEPGHGTTFKIYLPRAAEEKTEDVPVASVSRVPLGDQCILVVEDESALRGLLDAILSAHGFRVTVAANGGEALLLVEEQGLRPDLLVTDVVMPGMNGAVLVERLRKTCPDLKALYMSGYTDNAIIHHGVLDPGTPYIQKPFTANEIIDQIQRLCGSPQ